MDEISGHWLIQDDKDRLDEWRKEHRDSFAGFLEDAALPDGNFRSEGDHLYLATDVFRRCFGERGPQPDPPR
jgi:hypothetical protein